MEELRKIPSDGPVTSDELKLNGTRNSNETNTAAHCKTA